MEDKQRGKKGRRGREGKGAGDAQMKVKVKVIGPQLHILAFSLRQCRAAFPSVPSLTSWVTWWSS